MFLLDGSTSITNAGFQDAKLFIKKLYSNFPIGEYSTHVGLVVFGEESKTIFDLIEYTDKQTLDMKLPSLLKYDSSGNFLGRVGDCKLLRKMFMTLVHDREDIKYL